MVAYVGAASGDNTGFQLMIGAAIAFAGGRLVPAKLASPRSKVSAAAAVLSDCDLVFVSGGDVELGMNVLRDRGVLPLFHELGRAGRPFIGISAGSIMLGRGWIRFPDDPAAQSSFVPCMGLAPVYVDAHAEEDGWEELRALLALLVSTGETAPVGYGLTQKGGLSVEPLGGKRVLTPFGTPLPRFVVREGRVVKGRDLALGAREVLDGDPEPPPATTEGAPPRRRASRR
jgi:hypothetical protein